MKAKAEKRSKARTALRTRVPVRLEANAAPLNAVTRDISPQGVFLFIDSPVEEGAQLEMVLPIPSAPQQEPDTWVRCKCRVVRVEEIPDAAEFGLAALIEEFEAVPQAGTGE